MWTEILLDVANQVPGRATMPKENEYHSWYLGKVDILTIGLVERLCDVQRYDLRKLRRSWRRLDGSLLFVRLFEKKTFLQASKETKRNIP